MPLGLSAAQIAGARAIIQAYRAHGLNPIGGLAVALNESNLNPGAVGDAGTSYGLFQLHRGGALPHNWTQSMASNPLQNANYAAAQIAHGGHGLSPAALQRYQTLNFERPANPAGDMSATNLARAEAIYAQLSGGAPSSTGGVIPIAGAGGSSAMDPAIGHLIQAMQQGSGTGGAIPADSNLMPAMPHMASAPQVAPAPTPVPVPPPPPPPPPMPDAGASPPNGVVPQGPPSTPATQPDNTGYMKQLMGHLGGADPGAAGIGSLASKGDALSQSMPESVPGPAQPQTANSPNAPIGPSSPSQGIPASVAGKLFGGQHSYAGTDYGVDFTYSGKTPTYALGSGVLVKMGSGWGHLNAPFQTGDAVWIKLDHPIAGQQYIYYAEGTPIPGLRVGQRVSLGQAIMYNPGEMGVAPNPDVNTRVVTSGRTPPQPTGQAFLAYLRANGLA